MHPCSANFFLINLLLIGGAATLSMATDALVPWEPTTGSGAAAAASCLPWEREALLAFKRGITGDPVGRLASWKKEDHNCCRWRGVRCSNLTGHVLGLHLQNDKVAVWDMYIEFYSDFDATALAGQITTPLLALEHLEHLDLSNNNLTGPTGRLPEFVGSLKNLRYLNLSGMPFMGMVPRQLGNLSKLQCLDLSNGKGMHSTDISWLPHLLWLRYLDLSRVNLTTIYDWPHVINMNRNLRALHLSDCSLSSASQSLSQLNLKRLEKLDLSENNFNHSLESCWFWNLTSLKYLDLSDNMLYGEVPIALGDMTSLQVFELLNYEGAPCTMEPNLLRNLCNLEILDIRQSLSYGNVTEMLDNLMYCSNNKLREVILGQNNLTGTLPTGLGKFTSLHTLLLYDNQLTGSVPYDIGLMISLTDLDLSSNNLTGEITEKHFAGLKSLKNIDLSYNQDLKIVLGPEWLPPFRLDVANFALCQIGPAFPSWLQRLDEVGWLDVSHTGITGQFPHWFSTVLSKLIILRMSNNQISGCLPANMEIMSVRLLDLSSNQITGDIPTLPPNLSSLDISNNMLSGRLASKNFGAPQLNNLRLSSNNIKGPIPGFVCELRYLEDLDLSNNLLEGEFPQCSGRKLKYIDLSNNSLSGRFLPSLRGNKQIQFLDLSSNKFNGTLPSWIGDLQELQFLALSNNTFSGHIPTSIGNLGNLYQLKLSKNMFSGHIPTSIGNLRNLYQLKLESNNISGVLP